MLYCSLGQEHLIGNGVFLVLPKEAVDLSSFPALAEKRTDSFFLELACPCGVSGELCHLDRTVIPVPAVVSAVTKAIVRKVL